VRQRAGKPSIYLLVFLAILSLFLFYLAERSQKPRRAEFYNQKIQAAELDKEAQGIVKQALSDRGYVIDIQNDPNMTGMIGPQYSLITTDRGYIRDKLISTNPNNAAVLIDLYHRANLQPGDKVAVTFTGAFPAMNIAVLAACKVMELEPVIITSVGASTWGANWDDFTWLDMESVLDSSGIWDYKSAAASIGGGNDQGRGLSPQGRELIEEAIARNNVQYISSVTEEDPSGSLEANIRKRIEIFDEEKGNSEYKAVINVGGGLAAVGSSQNGKLILPGYNGHLWERELPARGVINILAERRIPVIHLLRIADFAEKYGLPTEVTPEPEIGEGPMFVQEKYSITTTVIYTVILLVVLWAAIRLDFRYYIYRNKHLFVRKNV
jgi:poly-gamma-glutamate system protein